MSQARLIVKRANLATLVAIAFTASACNQVPPISASSVPLLDDLTQNPQYFPQVSADQLVTSLAQGDLIDIGESHETGLERTYIANLYSELAAAVRPLPFECLVETGGSNDVPVPLVNMYDPSDPVLAQFSLLCPTAKVFANPVSDYTAQLKLYTPKGRVLTHTGLRHMLPWALMYPSDFPSPQWVDIPPTGTINRQVPDSFLSTGKTVRAHAPTPYEDFLLPQLVSQIQSESNKSIPAVQIDQDLDTEITKLIASPALQFGTQEAAHIFEVHRVNLSFPNELAYLSILNHTSFSPTLLKKLIEDPLMVQFLKEIDPATLSARLVVPDSANETYVIAGSVSVSEPGTIFFSANIVTSGKTSQNIAYITISPTLAPSLGSTPVQ